MDVVLVPPGGGEMIPEPVRIRVLEDGSNTGHQVGVVELTCPPGSGGPPQHIHRKHSETFYVVSGTMRFTSAGEHVDVSAGGLVTAPIGVPHTFSNPDPGEWATCIGTVAPDLYIGYFRDLAALAAQRGGAYEISELDENAVRELMARYATEPYQPPGS